MKQRQTVRFEPHRRARCWMGTIIVESAKETLRVGFVTKIDGLEILMRLVKKKIISEGKAREVRRTIKRSPLPRTPDDGLRQEVETLKQEVEELRELAHSTAYLAEIIANDLGYEPVEDEGEQPPERLN